MVNGASKPNGSAGHAPGSPRDWNFNDIPPEEAAAGPQRNAQAKTKIDLPAIEDAAVLVSREIRLPEELIKGMLHRGAKMVIGGSSKSYKTWLLLDLALSVATGDTWLGFSTHRDRVLYINLEIESGFFSSRIRDVVRAKKIVLVPDQLDLWNLRGHAADIVLLEAEILKRVEQKYALIVIDPIYKVLGGRDENKAGDIADLLNVLERIAVRAGAAIVFGAHFSKGNQAGKDSMDRIGGSGVFGRDPDSILALTKHEEDDAYVVEATLRNHPPVAPFGVRWQFPLMRRDNDLNPAKLKRSGGRAKSHLAEDLLGLLPGAGMHTNEYQRIALEKLGMSQSTFHRLFRELKNAGKIVESAMNRGAWIKKEDANTVKTAI